jgi:ketosteroid isomerase-like protein
LCIGVTYGAPFVFLVTQEPPMSNVQTIQAGYAAIASNDPSVLFGAMAPDIQWNEAQGNPLADRNPYVGAQAIGEGVFGRLLAAIDNFAAAPDRFIDGGDDVVVLGRYGGTMKESGTTLDAQFCHVYRFSGDRIVSFQQYTDSAQWARLMP